MFYILFVIDMDYWYLENWKLKANVKVLPTRDYLQEVIKSCEDIMAFYDAIWYNDNEIRLLNKSCEKRDLDVKDAIIKDVLS